ncbi:hypothetical protein LTR84_008221 [Exophiala bonariae]|uniref:Fibroin-3 related protein n=1 Tax=Exophiala bonariae TaxID=1690606 RepID=A0AAV9MXX5_9EURO|nr:hypothetical protein LTR84_008221 [Exophiala bonariae]
MTDIINEVKSAPDTFTSWDKCMEKAYCKWPAIVGIVIGSLILLSFLWCVVQCICCGATLCSCCCGGCRGCGSKGSGRDRRSKHQDDYTRMPPTPYGGYQPAPAPMAYGMPQYNAAPRFATFEDPSRKIHEDSLPHMPSWDTAAKRRVEDTSYHPNDDLEMNQLDPHAQAVRGGGYNSVPHGPLSPQPQPDVYGHNTGINQPYNSDLGAQRVAPHENDYNSFQAVPLSPPPTYRSNSVAPSTADKFMPGTASPSPGEYNRQQTYQHQQPSSYGPSMTSTRYEPPQPNHAAYGGQQTYQQPPSFLQPGHGSYREV